MDVNLHCRAERDKSTFNIHNTAARSNTVMMIIEVNCVNPDFPSQFPGLPRYAYCSANGNSIIAKWSSNERSTVICLLIMAR